MTIAYSNGYNSKNSLKSNGVNNPVVDNPQRLSTRPDRNTSLKDKKSETLKVIQHLRNEAHRFGITFHRQKRSKAALDTELDTIPGIGEKTVVELLKHFRSVKRIKEASKKELVEIIGASRAAKIYNYYLSKKE